MVNQLGGRDGTMAERKKNTTKKPKKTKVYECLYHERWYDDLGKGVICHHPNLPNECICCGQDCTYIYSERECPGYKKGNLAGSWVISKAEKDDAKKFKENFAKKYPDMPANIVNAGPKA